MNSYFEIKLNYNTQWIRKNSNFFQRPQGHSSGQNVKCAVFNAFWHKSIYINWNFSKYWTKKV